MSGVTAVGQANLLTRFPAPAGDPPSLRSGLVNLYKDAKWASRTMGLDTSDYVPNKRHTLASYMFDEATFVAFNLPPGTVMTLMNNVRPVPEGGSVADLSGCGKCVDLVGTGKTEAVDLRGVGMNDCVSAFFWRDVDLGLGAIELFQDVNFGGNRITFFLSEWESGRVHSFSGWWMQDELSSLKWATLRDRQVVTLFDNSDGSGAQFANVKGWGSTKTAANLVEYRFNDKASSFRWDRVNPVKEVIAPFTVGSTGGGAGSTALTSVVTGSNSSTLPQPVVVALNDSEAQTVTVSTTDTHVTGISTTFSLTATAGTPGVDQATAKWAVTLNYDYTRTRTRTATQTKTVALSITQTVNAPPSSSYKATLLVNIGQIPATVYRTTAERWYDIPVTGAVADLANGGWYKRTEPVEVTVAGSLASSTAVNVQATPL